MLDRFRKAAPARPANQPQYGGTTLNLLDAEQRASGAVKALQEQSVTLMQRVEGMATRLPSPDLTTPEAISNLACSVIRRTDKGDGDEYLQNLEEIIWRDGKLKETCAVREKQKLDGVNERMYRIERLLECVQLLRRSGIKEVVVPPGVPPEVALENAVAAIEDKKQPELWVKPEAARRASEELARIRAQGGW